MQVWFLCINYLCCMKCFIPIVTRFNGVSNSVLWKDRFLSGNSHYAWRRTSTSHHQSKLQFLACMFMWSLLFDSLCLSSGGVGSLVYVFIYINSSLFWSCVHSAYSIELHCLKFLFLYFNFTLLHWNVKGEQLLLYFHTSYYETWILKKHFLKPVFIY